MARLLPTMGLGTWKAACGEVREAIKVAVRAGYRLIDCAAAYGNEKEIGVALNDVMSEVQYCTVLRTVFCYVLVAFLHDIINGAYASTRTYSFNFYSGNGQKRRSVHCKQVLQHAPCCRR